MTGIVGSGFGLYGYLPAVVSTRETHVGLLSRSYEAFNKRSELQFCKNSITWFDSEEVFFKSVSTLIFSVPPFAQVKYVEQNVLNENIRQIVLEKPLAPTPQEADHLLTVLLTNNKQARVGYIFLYTSWAQQTAKALNTARAAAGTLSIDWLFKAHHYKNNLENWKRYHHLGGSVLRFFGIQVIALLAQWGYSVFESETTGYSADDLYQWKALFIHPRRPSCIVNINSDSEVNHFNVFLKSTSYENKIIDISLPDPLGGNKIAEVDKRVSILSNLITDFDNLETDYDFYFSVNSLWSEVERVNRLIIINGYS